MWCLGWVFVFSLFGFCSFMCADCEVCQSYVDCWWVFGFGFVCGDVGFCCFVFMYLCC